MNRRHFLSGGGAAALLGASALPARAAARPNPVVLRLGFTGTRQGAMGNGAVALAQHVAEHGDGALRVELYPAASAGGEVEMTQDVRAGALDMTYTSSAGYALDLPALGIFDIPFLFRDARHARAVLDGPIGRQALGQFESAGCIGLAWGENGLRHLTTSNRPVRRAEDLAGLKLRVPQSPVMVAGFRAMGADAQPLPRPEVYAALASGAFQAQENPLVTIRDMNLDRVQRYLCLTGHVYSPALITIGRRAYERLSPDQAQALRAAAAVGAQASRATSDASETAIIDDMRRRGMTVVDDIDRTSFRTALSGARKDFEQWFGPERIAAIQGSGQ